MKERGKITNKEYQNIAEVSKPTASRDLALLVDKKILKQEGVTGKGTFYSLIKGSQTAQLRKKVQEKQAEKIWNHLKGSYCMRLYLQNIVDDIPFENLPAKWQGFFARVGEDGTKVDINY